MDENHRIKATYQLDLNSLKVVGEVTDGAENKMAEGLTRAIGESIKKAIVKMSSWTEDMLSSIQQGDHSKAYEIFKENKGFFSVIKKPIFDILVQLDRKILNKEEKKNFFLFILAAASNEGNFGKAEEVIDECIKDFGAELEPDLRQCILVAKANAAAQNNKRNVANAQYRKAIESADITSVDKAYAYRGLAKISGSEDESMNYHATASDFFLEAGEKGEAIKDIVHISGMLDNKAPEKSLEWINKAIELHDTESSLDKEFSASILQRKARYLHSLGRNNEAIKCIETACSLRESLVGNEHEQHACFTFAASLYRLLKKTEKQRIYENKALSIASAISSEEFILQNKLVDHVNRKDRVDDALFSEVEHSSVFNLKLSMYLYCLSANVYSFDEKLEIIDKGIEMVMGEKRFLNHDRSLFYYGCAQVYLQQNNMDVAVKNYELCLNFNPAHYPAIQNVGAILWKEKKWDKSRDFFTNQIEKLGETPTLSYCLGRSYFELREYQKAFPYFVKANGKVKGADIQKFIDLCIERAQGISLLPLMEKAPAPLQPISIDAFREALEEFSNTISSNSRMHFWKNDAGKYSWKSCPEEVGKQHLITALQMKFGADAVDIIQERPVGAGIIDLYIVLRGGLRVVIELKICGGAGYSSTYALSGENQLVHYLANMKTHVGFLVVFDGRMRDFGLGFKPIQSINNVTLYTTAIDMRPEIS